jgi:hypothetical protein
VIGAVHLLRTFLRQYAIEEHRHAERLFEKIHARAAADSAIKEN